MKEEWLKRRRMGIGSSDAASIHHKSPYMTELELYNEKTGLEIKEQKSFITERGHEYEPKARLLFEADWNSKRGAKESFSPRETTHSELNFLKANLDGISEDGKYFIEIKYVGKEVYESEIVPDHYWMQIQHQYLVTNAKEAYYVTTQDGLSIKTKFVPKDEVFLKEHMTKCAEFWNRVIMKKPPEPTEKDYVELLGQDDLIKTYEHLKNQLETIEVLVEKTKEKIISSLTHPRMKRNNFKIQKVNHSGSINYKELLNNEDLKEFLEENLIDIESYRSPEKSYYKISIK